MTETQPPADRCAVAAEEHGRPRDLVRRGAEVVTDHCATAACWWAALTGAAPHMLHAVGPLAGTALVAGLGGTLLFGGLALLAMVPLLWRERRRTNGWRSPVLVSVASVAVFALSAFVISPALMADDAAELPVRPQDSQVEHPHGG